MVEVLVALAIAMAMIPILVASYINILHGYDAINRMPARDLDLTTARNALLAEADYDTAQKGDTFEGATGRQVTWSAQIDPTTTADLFQVTFTCQFAGGSDSDSSTTATTNTTTDDPVTEIFRVLRPTWSQGTDSATLRAANKDRILQNPNPSPLSGIIGGDSAPSATTAAGKGKSSGKGGKNGAPPGKNTGKGAPPGKNGKGGNNNAPPPKGARPGQRGNNNGGGNGGGNNNGFFNNNGGFFNNNNGQNNGNNNGKNTGTRGSRRAPKQ